LLETGTYRWAVLGIHRAHSAPTYQPHETELLKRLAKHLRRALQIHRQFSLIQQENFDLYKLFDALKTGVILLDANASLIYSNAKAQNILEQYTAISLDQLNRLKVPAAYQAQLEQYIQSALFQHAEAEHLDDYAGGVLALPINLAKQSLMMSVVPFASVWHHMPYDQLIEQKVAIFLTEPEKSYQLAHAFLKQNYQLSNREIRICELFLNGYNLEAIAQECSLTLSSVRTYMKYIFAKTHCNTQVELFRLLASLTHEFEHIP
jgi:DNA-binding CsgD family transcriptional regulator